jgi:Tfp pilus assembly protein PilV
MHLPSRPVGVNHSPSPRCSRRSNAFTLAEVMIAAGIFAVASLGFYKILLKAYEVAALARYHDNAVAVLQTYADQFLRLKDMGSDGYRRELFKLTSPDGQGLRYWDNSGDISDTSKGLSDESSASTFTGGPMNVTLGGSQNGIVAQVTREVLAVNPGPGAVSGGGSTVVAAGELFPSNMDPRYGVGALWLGTFTIRYNVGTQSVTHSLSVLRAAP